jgi:hypothetical protein
MTEAEGIKLAEGWKWAATPTKRLRLGQGEHEGA